MLHCTVARGQPFASFSRFVIERPDAAAVGDVATLIDDVDAFGPRSVRVIRGIAHVVDSEGQGKFESLREIIRDDHTLLKRFWLGVTNVILQIGFHLPFVGGMCFANVNGQKIGVILVVLIDLNDVADLAAKGRSSETAEYQHERPSAGAFADVEMTRSIECYQPRVGRIAAHFQGAAMHVRQSVAHHPIRVLWTSRHVGQSDKSGDEQDAKDACRPFPETVQRFFSLYLVGGRKNSIIRGRLSSATCHGLACNARAHSR